MKSAITQGRFDWLTDSVVHSVDYIPFVGVQRMPVPIDPEIGEGWVEIFGLNLSMDVVFAEQRFTPAAAGRLLPLVLVDIELAEPVLEIQSLRSGRMVLEERQSGQELIFGHGAELFLHADRLHYMSRMDTSAHVQMTSFKVGISVLERLIGADVALSLLSGLQLMSEPTARVVQIPLHITSLLHSARASHLQDDMSRLFAQARIMEYLCELAHFASGENDVVPGKSKRAVAKRLFEELRETDGKPPTLDELAGRYNMSAKTLNDTFRQEYGKTIYAFITEHRLGRAHRAIENDDAPMKVLATQFGYSHVNHFITAFKRQFGYPPGSLRSQRQRKPAMPKQFLVSDKGR